MDAQKDAELFQALADPTRLRIVQILADEKTCGCEGKYNSTRKLCVNAIAQRAGVTQSAVSQHLRLLKHANLVRGEREGSFVHYSLDPEGIKAYQTRIEKILKQVK